MLQKGDVVRVLDHSGHISLLPNGKPTHTNMVGGIYSKDRLIVVETDCHFSVVESGRLTRNDILLWNETKKYYIFFKSCFLRVIGRVCPHCGRDL